MVNFRRMQTDDKRFSLILLAGVQLRLFLLEDDQLSAQNLHTHMRQAWKAITFATFPTLHCFLDICFIQPRSFERPDDQTFELAGEQVNAKLELAFFLGPGVFLLGRGGRFQATVAGVVWLPGSWFENPRSGLGGAGGSACLVWIHGPKR